MRRVLWLVVCGAGFAGSAFAQQSADTAPDSSAAAPPSIGTETVVDEAAPAAGAEPIATPAEAPEPAVDDEYYQDVDDKDFRPSEEIPADRSIPFPSDI